MVDIQKLLEQMTLDEKIGQLTQYEANVLGCDGGDVTGPRTELDLTEENIRHVGSVLNFASADMMRKIQDEHLAHDRNKIPMLFMMDVIHGYRTIYPIPLALGCSFDTQLVEDCSRMAAKEASAGGVQVTFTPMVDYVRDARWGRVMETCGEEAMINGMMGAATRLVTPIAVALMKRWQRQKRQILLFFVSVSRNRIPAKVPAAVIFLCRVCKMNWQKRWLPQIPTRRCCSLTGVR